MKRSSLLLWLTLLYWMFVILVVYLADIGQAARFFGPFYQYPGGDKVGHFLFMGMLSLMTNLTIGPRKLSWGRHTLLIGTALVWGVVCLEEMSQYWLAERNCSWLDLLADTLGIWLGDRLASYSWVKTSSGKLSGTSIPVKSRGPRSPESKI